MSQQRLIVIIAAIVLIVLLQLFIKKTTQGTSIEAIAQNREGAMLVGINVNWVSSMTFAISAALAAAAASLVAPIFMISPDMGVLFLGTPYRDHQGLNKKQCTDGGYKAVHM